MTTPQQLELFSRGEPMPAPAPLPTAPPAPIRDPAGVLTKAGWLYDVHRQNRVCSTWTRGDDTLVLPHDALDAVAAWVRANPKLTAAQITERRELLDGLRNAATTPQERRARARDGRCQQCNAELTPGDLDDVTAHGWCAACSADVEGATPYG